MILIAENDNGRTIHAHPGESIQITLPENATTGYRWEIDHYDKALIDRVGTEPRYTDGSLGSGGSVAFIFRTRTAGNAEIRLKHWRHWEGDQSITNRFVVHIDTQP